VLEALAAGKAIVASPLALAGLDVEDGRQLLVAQTDEDFVRAISRVFDDEALRRALGESARIWALANLAVEKSAEKFERLYERMLTG
jgi:polysaccharide biosynthesis protein PslH